MYFSPKRALLCFFLLGLHCSVASALDIEDGLVMNEEEKKDFVLSLSEAIEDHPISLEAFSLVAQSQAMLDVAKANQKPQIKLLGNTRNSLERKFEDPLRNFNESSRQRSRVDGSLIIQQTLFDKSIKKEIAKQEKITQADFLGRQQKVAELTFGIILSCQNTAVFHRIGRLIEDSITSHRKIAKRIKIRVESGRTAASELSRANARLAEAEAKKMAMDLNLRPAIAEFTQFLPKGVPCRKLFPIELGFLSFEREALLVGMQNNFSLLQASRIIEAAEQELERAKASFKPKVSAELRGDRYDLGGGSNYDVYAGINFNFDLYTGGRKSSMVRVAAEQLNGAIFRKDILIKELNAQLEANLAELNYSESRIRAFTLANDAYKKSRSLLTLQFESANASLLELLEAERDYLGSAESLLMNHKSILSAHTRQLFLLGQLNNYLNDWIESH